MNSKPLPSSAPVFQPPAASPSQRWVVLLAAAIVLGPLAYYVGRREIAKWYLAAARQHRYSGELALALRSNQAALGWNSANVDAWIDQTGIHLSMGDAQSAIAPAERALELARAAYEQLPSPPNIGRLWTALNSCAYVHALDQSELERALTLINEVFELAGRIDLASERDTRGYIQLLLGNHALALEDLEAAVSLEERNQKTALHDIRERARMYVDKAPFDYRSKVTTDAMAVLYHHRGLAYQAMGDDESAEEDLQRAAEMGFDPQKGVW